MSTDPVNHRSLRAWLAVAMFAPLAHYSGGSWPVLLVLSLGSIGVLGLLPRNLEAMRPGKLLCAVEFVWLTVLAGHYLSYSAVYWPGEKSGLAVPAVTLLLGAYGCKRRPERVAAVLCGLLLLMLIPFGLAVLKDAQAEWLLPQELSCSAWVVPVLLLPAAAAKISEGSEKALVGVLPYVLGVLVWIGVGAVLSPQVASMIDEPFREISRTLDLGAGSRFESLISVMITLGWFSLASLFIRLAMVCLETLGIQNKWSLWLSVIPMILLAWYPLEVESSFSAVMTLVLWIVIPIFRYQKISKKIEKSA